MSTTGARLRVITVDQAVASASNLVIALLAAHVLGVESFGLFGIVFPVYVVVQGVGRALVSEPMLVHPDDARRRPAEVVGAACLVGVGLAPLVLAAGLGAALWQPALGEALAVLAACLPLLVLQDVGRYLGFAVQRPGFSLLLDLAWLVLLFLGVVVLLATGTRSLAWFIVAWAGSGSVAGGLVLVRQRGLRVATGWLRERWAFSWRYLLSYGSAQGGALAASVAVGVIAGAAALGGVRGTLVLVGPFLTFQVAVMAAAIADVARLRPDDERVGAHVRRTTLLATGAALANAVAVLLLPDGPGRLLLGQSWPATEPLLLPAAVQVVLMGLACGVRAGLLGTRAIRVTVVVDVAGTVTNLALTVVGALLGGAAGALWAVAVGQGLLVVAWWAVYVGHRRPGAVVPPPILEGQLR